MPKDHFTYGPLMPLSVIGSMPGRPKRTYLASPFWHPDRQVRAERARLAADATRYLISRGAYVYSPIVHGFALDPDEQLGGKVWLRHCLGLIPAFESLVVLRLQGWEASKGVAAEVECAARNGLTIARTDPLPSAVAHSA